jgi:hypothetical protein
MKNRLSYDLDIGYLILPGIQQCAGYRYSGCIN